MLINDGDSLHYDSMTDASMLCLDLGGIEIEIFYCLFPVVMLENDNLVISHDCL